MITDSKQVRPIAIYLPQFHPIPENDLWWGKGFTEWTNVAKARPLFKAHYQPHLPADLGFYDLRLPEVRAAQARLAAEYGIYGFCYYHYWFNGRRILGRPFQEVFESGEPDFPFMLCWANENWTRAWDGKSKDILLAQHYSAEDDLNHIRALIPYFRDRRYIRINGKPVIAIYGSQFLPDAKHLIDTWRIEAAKHGLEIYICRFESHHTGGIDYLKAGFDAAIDFQPWGQSMAEFHRLSIKQQQAGWGYRIVKQFVTTLLQPFNQQLARQYVEKINNAITRNYIFDYEAYVDFVIGLDAVEYKRFPCLMPMWDNSPRRAQSPGIFVNATPGNYKKWLVHILNHFVPYSKEENLLFINAWNEWGEGNHLEPCSKWGRQYLEVTRQVLKG